MPSFIILNSKNGTIAINVANPEHQDFSRKIKAMSSRNYEIDLGPNESHLPFITQRMRSVKAACPHRVECPRPGCAACKVTAGFILKVCKKKVLPPGQY